MARGGREVLYLASCIAAQRTGQPIPGWWIMKQTLFPLVVLLAVLTVGSAAADVIDVPGDYEYIHDAVQAAAAGDTVLVAAGTYHDCTHETEGPGSTPACVIMKSGVTLRGSGVDATIIDAEQLGRGIFVEDVADCRIENLQVTNCFADIYGAAILVRQVDSSVAITDVKIFQNLDGGIICIYGASPVLTRVELTDNVAKQGGGLAIEENSSPQVYDSLIDGNSCPSGAGIFIRNNCRPVISRCVIQNNVIDGANGNGGGIAIQSSAPTITHCQIRNNLCLGFGGGVAFVSEVTGSMTDCVIEGNDAAGDFSSGGGVAINYECSPWLENLLIVGNTANNAAVPGVGAGGGMDIQFSDLTIRNCTIVGNSVTGTGVAGGVSLQFANPSLENCIIASSTSGKGVECDDFSDPTITGCNIWNNAGGDELCGIDGGCNFSADPLFCGTALHEYNLQPTSPCAPGNHPDGAGCGDTVCGAQPVGCGTPAAVGDVAVRIDPLLGNHPNPFNPRTTIFFELDEASPITLRIFDMRGRTIASFTRGELVADRRHEIVWDGLDQAGRAVPSGVYLYSLETSRGVSATRRMSLIR